MTVWQNNAVGTGWSRQFITSQQRFWRWPFRRIGFKVSLLAV